MYCPMNLGEFLVPKIEDWIPGITYRPEPPLAVRGGLNPWQDERQRQLYLAEERAWKIIQSLQSQYSAKEAELNTIIAGIRQTIASIEAITGKHSGLADAANYAVLLYSLEGGPYAWAVSLAKMGFDYFTSMSKKHKLGNLTDMYNYLAAKYVKVKAELDTLVQQVTEQLSVSQQVKVAQAQQITVQTQQSEATYAQRQQTEAAKGAAYRAMNQRMAALFPTPRQGVSNDL